MPTLNRASLNLNPWTSAAADPTAWHATTNERREELMNVLPPIYVSGGFGVGEPIRHDDEGRPVYLCVATVNGQTWVRELPRDEMALAILALRTIA